MSSPLEIQALLQKQNNLQNNLRNNYQRLTQVIAETCESCGRKPEDICLIWVSKTRSVEAIAAACKEGARIFGENKVQECIEKFPLSEYPDADLHFIGRLQSNKVRKVVPLASTFHSVDSLKLLNKLDSVCAEMGLRRNLFLQVNTSGEESKAGFSEDEFLNILPELAKINNLNLIGLMTIGPLTQDLTQKTAAFRKLRELRDQIQSEYAAKIPPLRNIKALSMGMSNDFTVAIKEGSHYIRIGTDLFGQRKE